MSSPNETPQGRANGEGAQNKGTGEMSISNLSEASKILALLWLRSGARSLKRTAEIFAEHPEWGSA